MSEPGLLAQVFARLADGQFHSGEGLARELGVSRSAIWKSVQSLRQLGATAQAVRNRGYRLVGAGEPLAADRIRRLLQPDVRLCIDRLDVVWSTSSTNSVLMQRQQPPVGHGEALLAEYQTSGRGRRGRAWLAPPGGAICLSLSWTFAEVPRDLGAFGLVIGVCALRALTALGLTRVQLKWPNDLLIGERKLAGVLIELRAESGGPACVVIGIGLNIALGAVLNEKLQRMGLAPIDLIMAGIREPARNAIAAGLLNAFVSGILQFERGGLKPFMEEWEVADALRGRQVEVRAGNSTALGIARGIDVNGALVLETPMGVQKLISGDVSVRAA
ncbi:MAG TPA: biotin--[acetyl-CoA-carboxylase] ligase [Steroidobacteraceae bacterium]